jgi:glucan 1,3-beta-glucosidase
VLEPWITPSLFDGTGNDAIIDEYTFCQYQDRSVATGKLKQHWDSWITENDIKWISGECIYHVASRWKGTSSLAEAGLNHIRVPIGYWAYDIAEGEPWINGQAEYLDKVVGWARSHNVKVMVDLHGAPGSQNGYDNSGRRGEATWYVPTYLLLRVTWNTVQDG